MKCRRKINSNSYSSKSNQKITLSVKRLDKQISLPRVSKSMHMRDSLKNLVVLEQNEQEATEEKLKDEELRIDLSKLEEEEQNSFADQNDIQVFHKEAILNYYKHYKKLDRVLDQNSLKGINSSPFTALLDQSQKQKLLPLCIGLVREQGTRQQLKLSNYKLGDKYAQILSAGIKQQRKNQLNDYKLKGNRMTKRGAACIIKSVSEHARSLDLSCNLITSIDEHLMKSVGQKQSQLQYLNLQNNKLGTKSVSQLMFSLSRSLSIRYLNVSKNLLSNDVSESLAFFLNRTNTLRELYIQWNRINSAGALLIFTSLIQNKTVSVADFSFNLLGSGSPSAAEVVRDVLRNNRSILHLDLSENNFNYSECQVLGGGLRKNRTMYGFHFEGNHGYIDSKGFLLFQKEDLITKRAYSRSPDFKIEAMKVKNKQKRNKYDNQRLRAICWVCDGWTEKLFQTKSEVQAYVHLSHQGFQGRTMIKGSGSRYWYLTMVPPGEITFFFTAERRQLKSSKQIKVSEEKLKFSLTEMQGCVQVEMTCSQRCVLQNQVKVNFDEDFETSLKIKPRFKEVQLRKQEKKWTFPMSVWASQWKGVDQELDRRCFERDWSHSKISKIIKNVQDCERVKRLLQAHYSSIRNLYKYYSALSPNGDVWSISTSAYVEFCQMTKRIIDLKLPLKIVDLVFITSNSSTANEWRGNKNNPERGMIRYQFLQSLVRLSDEKFIKNGVCESYSESVGLIVQIIEGCCQRYNFNEWRLNRYFFQENDILIKKYRPALENVYKRFSKLRVKPGERSFMSPSQFIHVCTLSDLTNYAVTQKDMMVSYNVSMMLQVDELESERHYHMYFIEFVQAFARVCDLSSLGVYGSEESGQDSSSFLCFYKFESGIYNLLRLCDNEVRAMFVLPTQSIFNQKKIQVDSD